MSQMVPSTVGLTLFGLANRYLEAAMSRVPVSLEVGAKNFFCGPESFTPDLAPIVGPAPELENYFVCAGALLLVLCSVLLFLVHRRLV
eukprot:COSAG05_NODE_812_length_7171_cov_13.392534_4_plen_88_part_00